MTGEVLLCVESETKATEYRRALLEAGLPASRLKVLIPPVSMGGLRELAAQAAGLVLAGGPDIHPSHYGEEPLDGADLEIDLPLDSLELELLAGAEAARTPIWAICRGMQTLNVHLGGSLYQDLGIQFPGAVNHQFKTPLDHPAHGLERISTGTDFGTAIERHGAPVNSRHHQAVKDLAPGLREVAWSPDGILESFEWDPEDAGADNPWYLRAVQWHPENLTALREQMGLWKDFIAETEVPR